MDDYVRTNEWGSASKLYFNDFFCHRIRRQLLELLKSTSCFNQKTPERLQKLSYFHKIAIEEIVNDSTNVE